ncbi:uncharacterized protein [Equus przewalskii]|uniref:Uncharacterized protein n=1 Tax=Equus przewalskii TaxID=9798 RepID=A0ABM4LHV6_EQUPR
MQVCAVFFRIECLPACSFRPSASPESQTSLTFQLRRLSECRQAGLLAAPPPASSSPAFLSSLRKRLAPSSSVATPGRGKERGCVLLNLPLNKPRSQEAKKSLRRELSGGGGGSGSRVGAAGLVQENRGRIARLGLGCLLSPLSSLRLLPPRVLMDGRRLRRGKNPRLLMSESCLNAQRGGRRERERDSKALSRACAGRAALALPGRAGHPRARSPARPRAPRAPEPRAPRAGSGAERPAAGPRLPARPAAAAPSRSSGPSRERGRVRVRGLGGGGREGARRSSSPGRGAPARHGFSKPSTSRKRDFLRLGGLCILSSHRWGWRRATRGPVAADELSFQQRDSEELMVSGERGGHHLGCRAAACLRAEQS